MYIYKNGRVFSTETPEKTEWFKGSYRDHTEVTKVENALHRQHGQTDREFLLRFFQKDHVIFDNFGESCFYVIPEILTQLTTAPLGV